MKVLKLKESVYDNVKENPEVSDILRELGFTDIVKPGMINTAGRFMTIPKGASMKGIELEKVKEAFKNKGFEIVE